MNVRLNTHCQIAIDEIKNALENVTAENGTSIEPDIMCIVTVALMLLARQAEKRPEATMGDFVEHRLNFRI